jgi:hypothetical protein
MPARDIRLAANRCMRSSISASKLRAGGMARGFSHWRGRRFARISGKFG